MNHALLPLNFQVALIRLLGRLLCTFSLERPVSKIAFVAGFINNVVVFHLKIKSFKLGKFIARLI